MLPLSNDIKKLISRVDPRTVIPVPDGELCHYLSSIEDDLIERGYLNIVLKKNSGQILGILIDTFQKSNLTISGQEGMKKLNASCIMNISVCGDVIQAQHWDGFNTSFDKTTLEVVGQRFTK